MHRSSSSGPHPVFFFLLGTVHCTIQTKDRNGRMALVLKGTMPREYFNVTDREK
jgi:hypothetical protein